MYSQHSSLYSQHLLMHSQHLSVYSQNLSVNNQHSSGYTTFVSRQSTFVMRGIPACSSSPRQPPPLPAPYVYRGWCTGKATIRGASSQQQLPDTQQHSAITAGPKATRLIGLYQECIENNSWGSFDVFHSRLQRTAPFLLAGHVNIIG